MNYVSVASCWEWLRWLLSRSIDLCQQIIIAGLRTPMFCHITLSHLTPPRPIPQVHQVCELPCPTEPLYVLTYQGLCIPMQLYFILWPCQSICANETGCRTQEPFVPYSIHQYEFELRHPACLRKVHSQSTYPCWIIMCITPCLLVSHEEREVVSPPRKR